MSDTGKTLGIIAIGLVGLLVYLAFYLGGAFAPIIGAGLAHGVIYLGLALSALMILVMVVLTAQD
jgi:hypothetical protein